MNDGVIPSPLPTEAPCSASADLDFYILSKLGCKSDMLYDEVAIVSWSPVLYCLRPHISGHSQTLSDGTVASSYFRAFADSVGWHCGALIFQAFADSVGSHCGVPWVAGDTQLIQFYGPTGPG
jgi:hypothetical protein